jgi:AbiV family abortive infection protein
MSGVVIRRGDLSEGVKASLTNSREFLEGSLASLDAGLIRAAAAGFALAVQEIGKAKLLSDALTSRETNPRVKLYDHAAKVAAAQTILGSSALWLRAAGFDASAFDKAVFDASPTVADEATRLEMTYVNYGSTGWQNPPPIAADDLRLNISSALGRLPDLEKTLVL